MTAKNQCPQALSLSFIQTLVGPVFGSVIIVSLILTPAGIGAFSVAPERRSWTASWLEAVQGFGISQLADIAGRGQQ